MSEPYPERPITPLETNHFQDTLDIGRVFEERASRMIEFFHTEVSAFAVLEAVAAETIRRRSKTPLPQVDDQGIWQYYPAINWSATSDRYWITVGVHTNISGAEYPLLRVRDLHDVLTRAPGLAMARPELPIAKGYLAGNPMVYGNKVNLVNTLLGPPEDQWHQNIVTKQQAYVTWLGRAASVLDVPLIAPYNRQPSSFSVN